VERFNKREWDAALEWFQAAVAAGVQPARAWLYLGKIAAERGDSSKAEEAYRKALSIDPGSWEAANNLGALLGRTGKTESEPSPSAVGGNPTTGLHLNLVVLEKEEDRRQTTLRKSFSACERGQVELWKGFAESSNRSRKMSPRVQHCSLSGQNGFLGGCQGGRLYNVPG
jgi:tetratricopeptide (TPR) repeat protein